MLTENILFTVPTRQALFTAAECSKMIRRKQFDDPGIRVVGKGSWKKLEDGKSDIKLERMKLESSRRSWKVRAEVRKYQLQRNFPTSDSEVQKRLSNFGRFFPTSRFPRELIEVWKLVFALERHLMTTILKIVLTQ